MEIGSQFAHRHYQADASAYDEQHYDREYQAREFELSRFGQRMRLRYNISFPTPEQRTSSRQMPDLLIPPVLELTARDAFPPQVLGLGETYQHLSGGENNPNPITFFWDKIYGPRLMAAVRKVRAMLRNKIMTTENRDASILEQQVGWAWSRTRFGDG